MNKKIKIKFAELLDICNIFDPKNKKNKVLAFSKIESIIMLT